MVELRESSSPASTATSPQLYSKVQEEPSIKNQSHGGLISTLVSIAGIYVCFLTQGIVQESIYSSGTEAERFRSPLFLVAMVCMLSCTFGLLLSKTGKENQVLTAISRTIEKGVSGKMTLADRHLFIEGFCISLSYVGAMAATNFALTRVNYPTQVLVKSAKAVPVIVGGLFYGRRYPLADYLMVLLVTGSLLIFQYGNLKARSSSGTSTLTGFLALFCSLTLDGLTGPRQDRLVGERSLGTGDLMLLINIFATPICFSLSLLIEGTAPYIQVMSRLAYFLPRIMAFVVCGAMGQIFVVRVLRALGSLHLTLITTTRKFFAILISVMWFRHPLSITQWLSVVMIFSSGFIKYAAKRGPPAARVHVKSN